MSLFKNTTAVIILGLAFAMPSTVSAQSMDDLAKMQTFLDIMNNYFGIIESTYDIGSSAEKSAIIQMKKIQELYEDRGEKARSVEVLSQVLEQSRNQTIRNAAYMFISDTLKETGRTDEAIKILHKGLSENINAAK